MRKLIKQKRSLLVLAALAAAPQVSRAADVFWTDAGDDFSSTSDWTPFAPGSNDNAIVNNNTGSPVITQDATLIDIRAGDDYQQLGFQQTGSGTVTQNSGNVVAHGWIRIASSDVDTTNGLSSGGPVTGTYNLNGGTINLTGQDFNVAEGGFTGTLNVKGGAITAAQALYVGFGGGHGTVNQTAGDVVDHGWVSIGGSSGGTGVYNISGGTLTGTNDFQVGDIDTGTTGTLNISGTAVVSGKNVWIGKNSTNGTVVQTGGTFLIGAGNLVIAQNAGSTGIYTLSGGTLDGQGNTASFGAGTATFTFTGGTVQNFKSIGFPITQAGGTLHASAAGGVGSMTLTAPYSQAGGAKLLADVADTGSGPTSDVINAMGGYTLAGLLDVHENGGTTVPTGDTFTILTGSGTGAFTNAPTSGSLITADNSNQKFMVEYGTGGVTLVAQAVPEPASLGMLGLGAVGLIFRRRRA